LRLVAKVTVDNTNTLFAKWDQQRKTTQLGEVLDVHVDEDTMRVRKAIIIITYYLFYLFLLLLLFTQRLLTINDDCLAVQLMLYVIAGAGFGQELGFDKSDEDYDKSKFSISFTEAMSVVSKYVAHTAHTAHIAHIAHDTH
jgi:hypothetical protein